MSVSYRTFAIWTLHDLAIRQNDRGNNIVFSGNHVSTQYARPVRSPGETHAMFALRLKQFHKAIPRRSDLSERLALALHALVLDGEKTFAAANHILHSLRNAPTKKKAEFERLGIGYAYKPIDSWIGATRRGRRETRKKRRLNPEIRCTETIRAQAYRFIREHENFAALFDQRIAYFRTTFARDAEWYAGAESSYTARAEAFGRRAEPFDWFTAMPLAATAQLYHEQRKFEQAALYYRKAISHARRAIMDEDFRVFVMWWLRAGVKSCKHKAGLVRPPAYRGPRMRLFSR